MGAKSSLFPQKECISRRMNNKSGEKPHFYGHRQRLKQKFSSSSSHEMFHDYELLELLLFPALPRKDIKPIVKSLLDNFGTIAEIIYSEKERLLSVAGTNESMYLQLLVAREIMQRVMRQNVIKKNVLSSWSSLIDYLKVAQGHMKTEQFRILFLNKKNILIADELQTKGTIDQTPIYPREVVKRALFHEASAIILVHNHPSGNPMPSKADIHLTDMVVQACQPMNITVHDHVIVCHQDFYSFKSNALL